MDATLKYVMFNYTVVFNVDWSVRVQYTQIIMNKHIHANYITLQQGLSTQIFNYTHNSKCFQDVSNFGGLKDMFTFTK